MSLDIDELVLAIAEKFTEHKMRKQLELLRAFYRSRRKRKRERLRQREPEWDEDAVLAWAALWRIPPFENVYPQLPRPHCPCAKASQANSYTKTTFPEGVLMHCQACNTTWLVLNHCTNV